MDKYIKFNTQKKIFSKKINFENNFYKLLSNSFYGKTTETVRNKMKTEFYRKDDDKEIFMQQSNLTFKIFHVFFTNYVSYKLRQNELLKDKPNYLGFAILDLSNFYLYE